MPTTIAKAASVFKSPVGWIVFRLRNQLTLPIEVSAKTKSIRQSLIGQTIEKAFLHESSFSIAFKSKSNARNYLQIENAALGVAVPRLAGEKTLGESR